VALLPGLIQGVLDANVSHVKTITSREFFHWPSTVKALQPGQSLAVTHNGVPSFIVTKAGKRPRRTLADLEREAREICPQPRKHKVDFAKASRDLKGR
jgi:antitoxin component of MazEF toxin-antitoxin module